MLRETKKNLAYRKWEIELVGLMGTFHVVADRSDLKVFSL